MTDQRIHTLLPQAKVSLSFNFLLRIHASRRAGERGEREPTALTVRRWQGPPAFLLNLHRGSKVHIICPTPSANEWGTEDSRLYAWTLSGPAKPGSTVSVDTRPHRIWQAKVFRYVVDDAESKWRSETCSSYATQPLFSPSCGLLLTKATVRGERGRNGFFQSEPIWR